MIYKTEYIFIPENYVRLSMKTREFDEFIKTQFGDDNIIYKYRDARYFFFDENFVVEEQIERQI